MELSVASVVSGLQWAVSVFRPAYTAIDAVKIEKDKGFLTVFSQYWAMPIIFSLASDFLVFQVFGLDLLSKPYFATFYVAISSLSTVFNASILYLCLLAFGERRPYFTVMCLYTTYVVYYPFYAFLGFYKTYNIFGMLRFLKNQHLGLQETAIYYVHHIKDIADNVNVRPPPAYTIFAETASTIVALGATLIVAELISQCLGVERFKAYLATVASTFLAFLPKAFSLAQWGIVVTLAN